MNFLIKRFGLLLMLVPVLPVLLFGLKPDLHDAWMHRIWIDEFARALIETQEYPRWLIGMNGGMGAPTMFYYPPLPYLVPSLWKIVFGVGDVTSPMALGVGCVAAFAIAACGMHKFLSSIVDKKASVLGTMVYVVSPYYLGIDLYGRGAYAEFWAFSWMPIVLFGVIKLRHGNIWGLLILSASYGALIASHLPTVLVFSPVVILFSLIPSGTTVPSALSHQLRPFISTGLGMLLGIGLAAPYFFPAMLMQDYVHIEYMTTREDLRFVNQFLFGSYLWDKILRNDEFLVLLHVTFAVTLACGVLGYFRGKSKITEEQTATHRFFFVMLLGAAFMIIPPSFFVWDLLPQLQKIQFPWRLVSLMTIAASILFAFSMKAGDARRPLFAAIYTWFFLGVVVLFANTTLAFDYVSASLRGLGRDTVLRMDAPEYRPVWATRDLVSLARSINMAPVRKGDTTVGSSRGLEKAFIGARFDAENSTLVIRNWLPRRIEIESKANAEFKCVVSQLYYPGWSASVEGRPIPMTHSPDGLLEVLIPEGDHSVEISLGALPPEKWGNRTGVSSAVIWSLLLLVLSMRKVLLRKRSDAAMKLE